MTEVGPALAVTVADYFKALVEKGLERGEALKLTRDYQSELFESGRSEADDASG